MSTTSTLDPLPAQASKKWASCTYFLLSDDNGAVLPTDPDGRDVVRVDSLEGILCTGGRAGGFVTV